MKSKIFYYIFSMFIILVTGCMAICVKAAEKGTYEYNGETVTADENTFIYDGTNLDAYNGEKCFVMNVKSVPLDRLNVIRDKNIVIDTLVYSDIVESAYYEDDFPHYKTLYIGMNFRAWNMYHLDAACDEIVVCDNNPGFYSVDGVIYSKDKKELVMMPRYWSNEGRVLKIPDEIKIIYGFHIRGGYYKELILPENLEDIIYSETPDECGHNYPGSIEMRDYFDRITVPEKCSNFEVKDGCLYKVTLKEGKKEYDLKATVRRSQLPDTIHIPNGAKSVSCAAFKGKTVIIPKSVKRIHWYYCEYDMFEECKYTKIKINKNNPYLIMYKDGLYNKDKTKLYYYMRSSKRKRAVCVLPDTIKRIGDSAFRREASVAVKVKGGRFGEVWQGIVKKDLDAYYTVRLTVIDKKDKDITRKPKMYTPTKTGKTRTVDGILYTEDMTELIKIPDNWGQSHLVLPDTVKRLYLNRITNIKNTSIESITLSRNLEEIYASDGGDCEMECYGNSEFPSSIKHIIVPKGMKNYRKKDGCIYRISKKNGETEYELQAYDREAAPKKIRIPKGVKEIYCDCFEGKTVVISETVERIYAPAKNIKIKVSKNNPNMVMHKGCLYNSDRTVLYYYFPAGKKKTYVYKVPKKLKQINPDAFILVDAIRIKVAGGRKGKRWQSLHDSEEEFCGKAGSMLWYIDNEKIQFGHSTDILWK